MIKGTEFTYLEILNFWLSLTIQHPQNKFIHKKCIQNNNKKAFSVNRTFKLSRFKYREKFDQNHNLSYKINILDMNKPTII